MINRLLLCTSVFFFLLFLVNGTASSDDLMESADCLSSAQQKEITSRLFDIINEPVDGTREPGIVAFRERHKLAKETVISTKEALTICRSTVPGGDESKDAQCREQVKDARRAQENFDAIDDEAVLIGQRLLKPKYERIKALRAEYPLCAR
ncbi:MAG TPA: hypothetical protein VJ654_18320 [Noviherbaspirillum sp.]|nr:hypothetical protein [Noviherbaspirillum sp.]